MSVSQPPERWRGNAITDFGWNATYYFVMAPIEKVIGLYARRIRALSWDRDVYGQTRRGVGWVFYQFKGHSWTGAETLDEPASFSRLLGGRVLVYGYQKFFSLIYYDLYDCGERVESFSHLPGRDSVDEYFSSPPEPARIGDFTFESRLRRVGLAAEDDPRDFLDASFHWLDLYAEYPPISDAEDVDDQGRRLTLLATPQYRREDFERVDWVVPDPRSWPERRRDW